MTEKSRLIIDSWAWIEYFEGSKAGEKVKELVENEKNIILTSVLTLSEIVSKFKRKSLDPREAVKAIENLSILLPIYSEAAISSGEIHAEIREKIKDFGLADAFVLASARSEKAKIITGDPHFKNFSETIFIKIY